MTEIHTHRERTSANVVGFPKARWLQVWKLPPNKHWKGKSKETEIGRLRGGIFRLVGILLFYKVTLNE